MRPQLSHLTGVGMSSQVFSLPYTDSIAEFVVLFVPLPYYIPGSWHPVLGLSYSKGNADSATPLSRYISGTDTPHRKCRCRRPSQPHSFGKGCYDHRLKKEFMNGTRIRLTRVELYEKVWAAPMKTAAKEFGVSASSLVNVCRKHTIPVSAVYWTKIEVGNKDNAYTVSSGSC